MKQIILYLFIITLFTLVSCSDNKQGKHDHSSHKEMKHSEHKDHSGHKGHGKTTPSTKDMKVFFTNLKEGDQVKSSLKVCMDVKGIVIEATSKGSHKGRGHLHILIDTDIPKELDKPLPHDNPKIHHMGDGSKCKEIELSPGEHTLTAFVANGNHVSFVPPVYNRIKINVTK